MSKGYTEIKDSRLEELVLQKTKLLHLVEDPIYLREKEEMGWDCVNWPKWFDNARKLVAEVNIKE